MRSVVAIILLTTVALGITFSVIDIPFGTAEPKMSDYYVKNGRDQTGAANIVTSVVVNYRGFDTLGEVAVLFVAAVGLGSVLAIRGEKTKGAIEPASMILHTGCRFLFPLILLFGAYVFLHGHLTPGGGFQGGAIIASAFVLVYLGCRGRRVSEKSAKTVESLGGLAFVLAGLMGLASGSHYFLSNFLPKGTFNTLFSAGIIPIIYIAIGVKVGSELAGIIDDLVEKTE